VDVIYFLALVLLLFYLAGSSEVLLVNRVLVRSKLDLGARQAIGAITRYVILFLGLLIILQTVGINLTTLNVSSGRARYWHRLWLAKYRQQFHQRLIILFERPIRVGDRIEISDVEGDVVEIGARSTKVLTTTTSPSLSKLQIHYGNGHQLGTL
jgi:small-conductance mechanosensitive channel